MCIYICTLECEYLEYSVESQVQSSMCMIYIYTYIYTIYIHIYLYTVYTLYTHLQSVAHVVRRRLIHVPQSVSA